ncbi:DUF5615 family PIN-like protein [Flavobacterium sp. D11R37]|uniref:DUF5615 family PIN-like protein n=1 Tax=Flavobacterium coralii TaxID=2838017 RepID=UPI001CA64929|nr:DUF5615 family PIN-like protein [Flavobacterium coralii]MBY8961675.1 DUF5615 family PIN-like protein [Flavobacterium coralii]
MPVFLIDVNLPYYFSLWKSELYIHQIDIDDCWTDEQIWNYAMQHNLTIVTKDSDFSNKIMLRNPPPKVIHIRFGNMKMNEFHQTISRYWDEVLKMNQNFKLVNVYIDRIEGFE